jgi:hypothetical protein
MEFKKMDLVRLFSGLMSALSVLGHAALAFGPWAVPAAPVTRTILTLSGLTFWMIYTIATSAGALLEAQADRIEALQRQLADQQSGA